ncbi:MAG: hypothetical protein NC080_04790 [Paraprevotella sp.]|nr:hypothetical protein [Paraprevotella sp.]
MKNIIKTCIMMASCLLLASEQPSVAEGRGGEPLYRTSGYKGSVSLTDQILVWVGFDTSHGYMFNEHHYLGAGAGFFMAPIDALPMFGHVFAEYKAYILKKNSTPTAGLKAGYCGAFKNDSGNVFNKAAELEPNIGWSWTFSPKVGLSLSLGAPVFMFKEMDGSTRAKAMPKVSISIEF